MKLNKLVIRYFKENDAVNRLICRNLLEKYNSFSIYKNDELGHTAYAICNDFEDFWIKSFKKRKDAEAWMKKNKDK